MKALHGITLGVPRETASFGRRATGSSSCWLRRLRVCRRTWGRNTRGPDSTFCTFPQTFSTIEPSERGLSLIIDGWPMKTLSSYFFKGFIDEDDKLSWEERRPTPLPLDRSCSCVYKDRFVVIGGEWTDMSNRTRMTTLMFRYLELTDGTEVSKSLSFACQSPFARSAGNYSANCQSLSWTSPACSMEMVSSWWAGRENSSIQRRKPRPKG